MDHKLFGIFSGRQLTAIAITAILAPSVLYGAVATQAVSITDPNTGSVSYVDGARRVYTYDPIAGYANNPANLVDIEFLATNTCSSVSYTVPAGKALIVRAVTGYVTGGGASRGGFLLNSKSTCSTAITGFQKTLPAGGAEPFSLSLGAGAPIRSGITPTVTTLSGSTTRGWIHGYLVPASAVPEAGTAAAAQLDGPPTSAAPR